MLPHLVLVQPREDDPERDRDRLIVAHEHIAPDRFLDRSQQNAGIDRLARRLDVPVLIERRAAGSFIEA